MRKVMVIMAIGWCFAMGAYATTLAPSSTQPAVTASPDKSTPQLMATSPSSVDSDFDQAGSGDEVDLAANDAEPDAEDVAPQVK